MEQLHQLDPAPNKRFNADRESDAIFHFYIGIIKCIFSVRLVSFPGWLSAAFAALKPNSIFSLDIVNVHVNIIYIMREIIFYRTSTGYCPVEKFLDLLPSKHSKKVSWVLSLIEDLPMVPKQYFKKLVNTDDIWEVRVKSGGEAYRLLGFFDGTNLVVLDYAFQKKTRKTPQNAIKTAEERKREYFKRRIGNE